MAEPRPRTAAARAQIDDAIGSGLGKNAPQARHHRAIDILRIPHRPQPVRHQVAQKGGKQPMIVKLEPRFSLQDS
jgi:hypothetical protein